MATTITFKNGNYHPVAEDYDQTLNTVVRAFANDASLVHFTDARTGKRAAFVTDTIRAVLER